MKLLNRVYRSPVRCVGLALIALCLQACVTFTSPWKDPQAMRDDLLKATPLGSSFSEVEKKLKARRLPLTVSLDAGFTRQELFHPPEVVGEKSIGTRLGSYRSNLLTETIVIAYWGFDKNGSLIEIWVEEQNDSL